MENILIITDQNTTVSKIKGRLILKNKDTKREIHTNKLSAVIIFGNVQITTQAISLLSYRSVPITALSFNGKIKYMILPPNNKNIDLKLRQYEHFTDKTKRLELAKFIALSKLHASVELLQNIRSRHKSFKIIKVKKEINVYNLKISNAITVPEILGYEGNVSKIYFRYLSSLSAGDIKFTNRTKHPPKDEANALLSYIYTIFLSLIYSIVYADGFDIYTGFLHTEDYARPSFTLDVLELFRSGFCDRFFLNITNGNIIKKNDFELDKKQGYLLTADGKKKFFTKWHKAIFNYEKPNSSIIFEIQSKLTDFSKIMRNKTNLKGGHF